MPLEIFVAFVILEQFGGFWFMDIVQPIWIPTRNVLSNILGWTDHPSILLVAHVVTGAGAGYLERDVPMVVVDQKITVLETL
jgi:hypothetical protein